MNGKYYAFFENFREVIKKIPREQQLDFREAIDSYCFDGIESENMLFNILIQALKPSLDKRFPGGARPGSGAPVGNDNAKIIKKNPEIKTEKSNTLLDNFPNWLADILTGKESAPDECDLPTEQQEIYRKINPYINRYLTDPTINKTQIIIDIKNILQNKKPENLPPLKIIQRVKFTPPTLDQWLDFCREKNLDLVKMKSAWESYNVADWHDSQGSPVRNWKQKILQVWNRPEHANKAQASFGKSKVDILREESYNAYAGAIEIINKREAVK